MRLTIKQTITHILADKGLLALAVAIVVMGIGYCLFVLSAIHPRDIQVATHYTAFGPTQIYKEKWYYLFNFVVFGLAMTLLHIGVMAKLIALDRLQLAKMFGWLTIFTFILVIIITNSILTIAAL